MGAGLSRTNKKVGTVAKRGLLSWLTGGAVESIRDVPVIGWLVEKVAPEELPKEQVQRNREMKARAKAVPKGRGTRGSTSKTGAPRVPRLPTESKAARTARDLQADFMNPFASDEERVKAMKQWMKIHPRPGESGLTPNEMRAFRETYALTEQEKW